MWRIASFVVPALASAFVQMEATAGAFMLPEGAGQLIAGVGYVAASRRFDSRGTAMPAPTLRKADVSGFLEYGVTSWFSVIAAPTVARQNGSVAANTVTGSDSSAVGGRVSLYSWESGLVGVQALVQPPIGGQSLAGRMADGGARSMAIDLRVPVGWYVRLAGLPVFLDVQPGVRFRADPFPTEARLDVTFGFKPIASLMVLLQDFSAFAPSSGPLVGRTAYSKGQASLVYDLSARWSAQIGVIRTLFGRNAVRETGPMGALWYRF